MAIEFNPESFNPNFWHLYELLPDWKVRYIWLYGGSSSSKTYSTVQAILFFTIKEAEDTLVFRKTHNSIEKTVYKDFLSVIDSWDMGKYFKPTRNPMRIKCVNGAVIDFAGMDDPEKIKGISQYKRVYANEISSFDEADYDQIRKRLRGKRGQQIICDFNPIDELHWIKESIFDAEAKVQMPVELDNGIVNPVYTTVTEKWRNQEQEFINPKGKKEKIPSNMVVIRSTYLNNFWVVGSPCGEFGFYDVQTIADFEADKIKDYNFYRVYALGLWGKVNVGGEFYKNFSLEKNVVPKRKWDKSLPLHISFDENVNPYLSLSIYQAKGDYTWKIDEICLENPKNTLKDTLIEFKKRFPPNLNGLFVYGDRTSLKEDTKLEKGQNFFTIVQNFLFQYNPSLRLPMKNPPVAMRGNFINQELLATGLYTISENCRNTINDYEYVKEASDGTKLKERVKHPITKVTYEKHGHLSDTDDYFLCEYYKSKFSKYQLGAARRPIIHRKTRKFK